MGSVGEHAGLLSREGDRRDPLFRDRHGDKSGTDDLSSMEQHVKLPVLGVERDVLRQVDKRVRSLPHGGDYDHDGLTRSAFRGDAASHVLDALGVSYR